MLRMTFSLQPIFKDDRANPSLSFSFRMFWLLLALSFSIYTFELAYHFFLFLIYKRKASWYSDCYFINLLDQFGRSNIIKILSLPIHEHVISLHLLRSSFMSLSKFYNISSEVLTYPLYYAELLDIFDATIKGIFKNPIFYLLLLLYIF